MSTYDDGLLAARFAALAPEPLAGDWDDVLDRAGAAPKGHREPERSRVVQGRRRRLIVVLAAVALVAVATASAFAVRASSPIRTSWACPPWARRRVLPRRECVRCSYGVHHSAETWVYADGRLIRFGARQANGRPLREAFNRWSMGFVEQRLTREGVRLLRSEIVSAGGFGEKPPPGSDPLFNRAIIQVRKGDRLVPLRWASDLEASRGAAYRSGVVAACERVEAAEDQGVRAIQVQGLRRAVISNNPVGHAQEMSPARIVALLPEAAQNVLRDRDWNARGAGPGCFAVTTNEARPLANALDGAVPAKKGRLSYTFNAPGPSRQVWITFDPYLPHGKTPCLQCG